MSTTSAAAKDELAELLQREWDEADALQRGIRDGLSRLDAQIVRELNGIRRVAGRDAT